MTDQSAEQPSEPSSTAPAAAQPSPAREVAAEHDSPSPQAEPAKTPRPAPIKVGERSQLDCLPAGKSLNSAPSYLDELAVITAGGSVLGWNLGDAEVAKLSEAGVEGTQYGALPVFTVGVDGVKEGEVEVSLDRRQEPSVFTQEGEFRLATRGCRPPSDVKLSMQRLEPVGPDADAAAKWIARKEGEPHSAVGEVRGTFGAGVDRFVVVSPEFWDERILENEDDTLPEPSVAEASCSSEFVVAMRGASVVGAVPLLRPPGDRKSCLQGNPFQSARGVELLGRVDLDQDGNEELLWVFTEDEGARVALTTQKKAKTVSKTLANSVEGLCDAYIDASQCGRAGTFANRGRPFGVVD